MRTCPTCAEQIPFNVYTCTFCKTDLSTIAKPGPKRRGTVGRRLLLVGLVILGGIALVVAAGAFFILTAQEIPVTDADRAMLITIEDLAPWIEVTPDPSAATLKKLRYVDFSHDLTYEYEDEEMYLDCEITVERKLSDAVTSYHFLNAGMRVGLSIAMTLVDADHLLEWGDASKCSIIQYEDEPVGNYFITRRGTRIFTFLITGAYFDDPSLFSGLLTPFLEKLDSYEP